MSKEIQEMNLKTIIYQTIVNQPQDIEFELDGLNCVSTLSDSNDIKFYEDGFKLTLTNQVFHWKDILYFRFENDKIIYKYKKGEI